jgi:ABC-type dipeptide/oligopeptide/nickel transport system ATPase component
MALMAHFVDDLGVMYAGRLVETGPVRRIFAAPRHPYSRALIESLPSFDRRGSFNGIPASGRRCSPASRAAPSTHAAPWPSTAAAAKSLRHARSMPSIRTIWPPATAPKK